MDGVAGGTTRRHRLLLATLLGLAITAGACASSGDDQRADTSEAAAPTTTLGYIAGRTSTTVTPNAPVATPTARAPEGLYSDATPVADVVGEELFDSGVLGLSCIPSRVDPVGTFFDFVIGEIEVAADTVLVMVERQDVRFGSHPSGCRSPQVMPGQSWFLLGPELEPLFAVAEGIADDGTVSVAFELGDIDADQLVLVLAPTIEYLLGNGDRQTTTYGVVGAYTLPPAPATVSP